MKKIILLLATTLSMALCTPQSLSAQCSSKNTAFRSGETLIYDLYFNWKFVWVKAGTASMNITQGSFNGKPAYRTYLITRGSQQADKFFVMRDTLISYTDLNLTPLYYRKGALEGKTYRKEEVIYSYPNGNCKVNLFYQREGHDPRRNIHESIYCAYDMLSMLLRARSFDPANFKKGHRIKFLMADGKRCEWQSIVYRGKKNFTIENTSTTYRCLVFSFMETEDGEEKEVVKFYVTDDDNHLPVRLDMNLNFGTAKAYLRGARGIRNPQTSKIK